MEGEMTPENLPPIIFDPALVVFDQVVPDGIVFRRYYRSPYLGTVNRLRAKWLREHPGTWRYLTPEERASLRPPTEDVVDVVLPMPNSPLMSNARPNTNGDETAMLALAEGGPPKDGQLAPATPPAAPEPQAQSTHDEIIIDGHRFISERRVAEILTVAKRTLQRWRKENRGPPWVKVGRKIFYDEDKLKPWMQSR
jgi:Helix-turn-helix domain